MLGFIRKLRHNERGAVIVLVTILMVALMGFTAMVVDVGVMFQNRKYLQNVADAAALAGAAELPNTTAARAKAKEYAAKNGYTLTDAEISFSDSNTKIMIKPQKDVDYIFGKALGLKDPVKVGTVSAAEKGSDPFWALNPGIISFSTSSEVELKDTVTLDSSGPILIHSNNKLIIKSNVKKTSGTEVYASAKNKFDDYTSSGFLASKSIGPHYQPPLTVEMLADLKNKANNSIPKQYFSSNVLMNASETKNWTGVVYIDGKLEVSAGGSINGGALIIVRDKIEFKGNANITGAFYCLGGSAAGIEFKEGATINVIGSVMSLSKIEFKDTGAVNVTYNSNFINNAGLTKGVRLII